MSTIIKILTIDHVQLAMPKGEEPAGRMFYGTVLGLREIEKPLSLQSRGGVWFTITNDRQIHLGVEENFAPNKKAHPCFVSVDLDGLAKSLEEHGFKVIWDDELLPVRRFYSNDCFGNRLEFVDRPTF